MYGTALQVYRWRQVDRCRYQDTDEGHQQAISLGLGTNWTITIDRFAEVSDIECIERAFKIMCLQILTNSSCFNDWSSVNGTERVCVWHGSGKQVPALSQTLRWTPDLIESLLRERNSQTKRLARHTKNNVTVTVTVTVMRDTNVTRKE